MTMPNPERLISLLLLLISVGVSNSEATPPSDAVIVDENLAHPMNRKRIEFVSSVDGSTQQAYLIEPTVPSDQPVAIVVSLHSWSANMEQRNRELETLVTQRGWYYLFPNFRGENQSAQACGSKIAQQDILDAMDWTQREHSIDPKRVYLTGNSGGGHMTMLMASNYPDRWRAVSVWVGISDLVRWHGKHKGTQYGNMLEEVCGGAPGDSPKVDAQYKRRSPVSVLAGAKDVAIDIATGIHDGHTGSVPIRHSIDGFNVIALSVGAQRVSEEEIAQLSKLNGRLENPQPGDLGFDPSFDREYYLRRAAGVARLTVFEGDHEGIATAAMAWFEQH